MARPFLQRVWVLGPLDPDWSRDCSLSRRRFPCEFFPSVILMWDEPQSLCSVQRSVWGIVPSFCFTLPYTSLFAMMEGGEPNHAFLDELEMVLVELQTGNLSQTVVPSVGSKHEVRLVPSSYSRAPTHIVADSVRSDPTTCYLSLR